MSTPNRPKVEVMSATRYTNRIPDEHALQSRVAWRLAALLSEQVAVLPHDITTRLRFARESALAKARLVRQATPTPAFAGSVSGHGTLALGGGSAPWWQRAFSLLPLMVLVGGLVMIDQWAARERALAAADLDAVLLADDLPPAAYSDPGFAEYLRSPPP